ncbi:MAG: [FeFe] hydrogenase H-cluster radical SAM maturase HydG [Candidatus Firestonebacteria bacterium RIFOXYC2_FULL_39_67]|nr:MAG: [FeFe] hydrogenase H-cluster radical SAM maturase HydG [Candidatus Firestonebacteria bacterium RIFOXYD2_FULL_39_29]OGF52236.1 MAG: [FeFe] hydrogenase H-cluster radical SAM maturase HydG [Candidatus Firestonebacteria bacterium RifOxyC12_full_39_7]OGF54281.1 MAG: [FeFe] hydrogenase H-cluster radical SAM maturase HydG [Candidatus Firestonebacteria bacterium RIFOXYC2_FULL_39_67]
MNIIDEVRILKVLEKTKEPDIKIVQNVINKAKERKGLNLEEVGVLINLTEPRLLKEMFDTAAKIKEEIYGERLVFFAPLYVSDYCMNDCAYCNFHQTNKGLKRSKLTLEQVREQVKILINMGHKRVLLEFGEDKKENPIEYVVDVINEIYKVKTEKGNIRRVNVNIAATTVENYKKIKAANIGTYQLFQETYHRPTYAKLHKGPKADYDRQLTAHDRALEAGIDDRGLGVLFGLYDWKFEVLGLIAHAEHMDKVGGVGPHTISVPRLCEAPTVKYSPEYPVSDDDFLKIIAILRLSVPYTGMIISTRETPEIRRKAFKIGISQTSAASVTSTGGYGNQTDSVQFTSHDPRSLEEVIKDALADKLLPSFCTACYRLGRTGEDFMYLSKPGEIHTFCRTNGLLTFAEYLEDFASNKLKEDGYKVIDYYTKKIENPVLLTRVKEGLTEIKKGKRDIFY